MRTYIEHGEKVEGAQSSFFIKDASRRRSHEGASVRSSVRSAGSPENLIGVKEVQIAKLALSLPRTAKLAFSFHLGR